MNEPREESAPEPRRRGGWRKFLLPHAPDVLGLLVVQGEVSVRGLDAFERWSHGGGEEQATLVRDARKEGHQTRRELLAALQNALSTPVDQEDLYVISERLDHVLDAARHAVREAEILKWDPDEHAAKMASRLALGTRELLAAFELLHKDGGDAGAKADAASEAVRHVERDYRDAMATILEEDDLRVVLAAQDLYRRHLVVADAIVGVADRLWYIVLQEA
jgi:uncharacterized protein Yka (UPF0111/DUF47 family)